MISHNTIDAIQQLPIVEVVTKFYRGELKRTGSTYRGLSPFNDEKTPSFYVIPPKNIFKDFSSGNGGGAINFVMLTQNLSYPLAIKEIAREFGIHIEEDGNGTSKEENDYTEELYKITRATARRYQEILWNLDGNKSHFHTIADEILKRQFTDETMAQWQIGYAPDSWNYLYSLLKESGKYQHGIELGLIKTKGEHTYDVFRHRLMFPILDERGHIVAFGGRYLPGALHKKDDPGNKPIKYINSSECRIFRKSRVLYGLFYAIHAIRKEGFARLVEGYTDVISMHQAGFANTVGSMGTSITEEQVQLLKRYTNKVVVIYDGDDAGLNAAERSGEMFLTQGFEVNVLPLPDGKDPDDFVRTFNN